MQGEGKKNNELRNDAVEKRRGGGVNALLIETAT